ncbi:MAG TPA: HEPN domain-containing protein [Thermodesulfobacteriota bacterium]|nr:HEPN domain-containing protein [Thermodesulfobacteriota bacterium]
MTEENKKKNIREELERAEAALKAATVLFEKTLLNDAVSRLYYFLLYNIRALLLTKGLEPKSHESALRLLGLHFIKEGIFPPKTSHVFSKLMKYREEADYNPSYVFTSEDFVELKKEAEGLSEKIKAYIEKEGYL